MRIALMAAIILLSIAGCRGNEADQAQTGQPDLRVATVALRAPNDPANKYCGQYCAWDLLIYQQIQAGNEIFEFNQAAQEERCRRRADDPTTMIGVFCADPEGDFVPLAETIDILCKGQAAGDTSEYDSQPWKCIFYSSDLEASIKEDTRNCIDQVTASYAPQFPGWLVADVPHAAMLLPNGDWVTSGSLGSGKIAAHAGEAGESGHGHDCIVLDGFFVFDTLGNQLGASPDHWWYALHGAKDAETVGDMDDSMQWKVIFRDPDTGLVNSVWSYDGSAISPDAPKPEYDNNCFLWFRNDQIARYASFQ